MPGFLAGLFKKKKYGDPIVVVSGLPRSGTSMMMGMLEAGGVSIMTDGLREADVDNPKGYWELERVKDLDKDKEKSWVREARGKCVKVISSLLKDLPPDNFYRVIFMNRDLEEVLASQQKMLDHRGEENPTEDERMKSLYRNHLIKIKMEIPTKNNFEMLDIDYRWALNNPRDCAARVNEFLGGNLNEQAMVAVVDKALYRNRAEGVGGSQY